MKSSVSLNEIFKTSNRIKDNFLSRVFGIFSEDIVRIWCNNPNSNYIDLGRPSLYHKDNLKYTNTTLDFSLKDKDENVYVAEQKCELAYQNYNFMELNNIAQLEHHKKKKAFERFLELAIDPDKYEVRINKSKEKIYGSILIWGKLTKDETICEEIKDITKLHEILSIENMMNDLIIWEDQKYISFLDEKIKWFTDLSSNLKNI